MQVPGLEGRVAIVTGANHGIGAATAQVLAGNGVRVLLSYLRLQDPVDPGIPEAYRSNRARDAESVVESIRQAGGQAEAVEANLRDPATPPRCSTQPRRRSGRSRFWSTTPPAGAPTPSCHPRPDRTVSAAIRSRCPLQSPIRCGRSTPADRR